jgi:hypothetical protein
MWATGDERADHVLVPRAGTPLLRRRGKRVPPAAGVEHKRPGFPFRARPGTLVLVRTRAPSARRFFLTTGRRAGG